MNSWHGLIDSLTPRTVVVAGDLILDRYLYTRTSRISREAPVLILAQDKEEYLLGGAGNTVRNLLSLGAEVRVVSTLGEDQEAEILLDLLKRDGADVTGVTRVKGFSTPLKTRVMAGESNTRKQQILRLDREAPFSKSHRGMVERTAQALEGADLLIVSDYGYSLFDPPQLRSLRRIRPLPPIFVDSRFQCRGYKGVTALTPNESEALSSAEVKGEGEKSVEIAAGRLLRSTACDCLLVTRGSRGMLLAEKGMKHRLFPIFGDTQIVDVTGAGDTVISVFSLAWAASGSFLRASLLANLAGALSVMKMGAAVLTPRELKNGTDLYKDSLDRLAQA